MTRRPATFWSRGGSGGAAGALRLLRGQVKCIYIDPPYNTGNEGWVYNDNVNSPEMRAWLGADRRAGGGRPISPR